MKTLEEDSYEPQTVCFYAKLTDKDCNIRYEGTKTPKAIKEFLFFFEDENGKIFKLAVREEYYDAIEIGQKGILTLSDEKFYSFASDNEAL